MIQRKKIVTVKEQRLIVKYWVPLQNTEDYIGAEPVSISLAQIKSIDNITPKNGHIEVTASEVLSALKAALRKDWEAKQDSNGKK